MTILSDTDLRAALDSGALEVTPLAVGAIRPNSIDLRLGPTLLVDDPNARGGWRVHDLRESPYRLYRGQFVLGATLERVYLNPLIEPPLPLLARLLTRLRLMPQQNLCADIKGKSSRAREGLVLENAGFVDSGWNGELTTEMEHRRSGFLLLTRGMKIGQLRVYRTSSRVQNPYGSDASSHYQGSTGPVASRAVEAVR